MLMVFSETQFQLIKSPANEAFAVLGEWVLPSSCI